MAIASIGKARSLKKLGRDARRRRINTLLMPERAFISRSTLARIEQGDPTVSMKNYAAVLFVLRMTNKIRDLADAVNAPPVGRALEEERLPKRIRNH